MMYTDLMKPGLYLVHETTVLTLVYSFKIICKDPIFKSDWPLFCTGLPLDRFQMKKRYKDTFKNSFI